MGSSGSAAHKQRAAGLGVMPTHRGEPYAFLLSPAQRLLERKRRERMAKLRAKGGR